MGNDMAIWRHDFHQKPELGFKEEQTADKVAALLESFGLQVHRGFGKTGIIGVLQRGNSTQGIGLRADMDALPIQETNGLPYRSLNEGIMHACGHDGHTSMLLGAAKYLAESGEYNGRVIFIFQPNEEHGLGASTMIKDGLLDQFRIDEIYGMHNIPGMPVGAFATRSGPITASESLFEIEISARGGHSALPHMGVDAITVGSQIVNALQTIVSRKLNPGLNGVVSVTEFITDGKRNILPGTATLRGDTRALTREVNETIEEKMRQIVNGICLAHEVEAKVTYETVFPSTINSPAAVDAAGSAARLVVGKEAVDTDCPPKLFSEDFAHFAAMKPGCFMLMGNGTEGPCSRPLHSADYDFNDDALVPGSSFWVKLVEQQLNNGAAE